MSWVWTEKRKGIVEYMVGVGHLVDDVQWWEMFEEAHRGGYAYSGWQDMEDRGEYQRRLDIAMEWQRYCYWWNSESLRPRAVNGEGVVQGVRLV